MRARARSSLVDDDLRSQFLSAHTLPRKTEPDELPLAQIKATKEARSEANGGGFGTRVGEDAHSRSSVGSAMSIETNVIAQPSSSGAA